MKAYTNGQNEIVSLEYKEGLTEVEIPAEDPEDMFYGKCAAFIMGFRAGYEECGYDENGNTLIGFVITPYKSMEMLDAIQQQYEHDQAENAETIDYIIDMDYRISMVELGLI